jgi:branched-chain amino acid transport system substrate-binding protein
MRRRLSRYFTGLIVPLVLVFLALPLLAAGCGPGGTGGNTGTTTGPITIKIGTDLPTSGDDTANGLPGQHGVELAIKDANDQKLVPNVTFVGSYKNDVGPSNSHEAAVGVKNVTDLIGDAQVAGIVGPFNSSVAQAEMPVTNNAPIAIISPANTNDCLTRDDESCSGSNSKLAQYRPTGKINYFRLATLDRFQGGALAEFAFKKGYKKVFIVDDTETYGAGIALEFKKKFTSLGGTVAGTQSVPKTTGSYSGVLTTIAAQKPDAIFFGGNDSTGGTPMRTQMKQTTGLENTPFLCGDGCKNGSFSRAIGTTGGPVFSSVATVDSVARTNITDTKVKDFLSKYEKAYTLKEITAYSASGYDCAMILINAVKAALEKGAKAPTSGSDAAAAKTFREAVIAQVASINYVGLTGTHSFDKNGDTTSRVITIYTIGPDLDKLDGWSVIEEVKITA